MRRLALASTLLVAVTFPPAAAALGVGQIEIQSALNQRLDAEIPLRGVKGDTSDDIVVTLASKEAFRDVGLDRPFSLTRLAFAVKQHDDGDYYIHVTSTERIVEPFLSFLVEVDWPGGNLLREYTVLLDPPVFTTDEGETGAAAAKAEREAAAADEAPERRGEKPVFLEAEERDEAAERRAKAEAAEREAAESKAREARAGPREYGPVERGDTLWSIASRLRSGDLTVQQMMLALLRHNREAFVDDNINRLQEGYVLRVPAPDEVASISAQRAMARVDEQNAAWQRWRRRTGAETTVAASEQAAGQGAAEGPTGAGAQGEAELDIVGAEEGGAASDESASAAAAGDRSASEKLQLTREQLESVRMEKQELESRVQELEKTVKKMEQLLMVRNDKLEQLQSQLEQLRDQPGEREPESKEKAKEDQDEEATEVAAAGTGGGGAGTAADGGGAGGAGQSAGGGGTGEAAETTAAAAETSTAAADATGDSVAEGKEAEGLESGPQTSPTQVPGPTWLDRVNDVLAAIGGVFTGGAAGMLLGPAGLGLVAVAVLLAALLVMRRRQASAHEEVAEAFEATPLAEGEPEQAGPGEPAPAETATETVERGTDTAEMATAEAEKAESALMAEEFDVGSLEEEGPAEQTALAGVGEQEEAEKDDTVAEADVYLAYGLHQQAEDLLRLALKESPDNPQYHEKLLETLYGASKKDEFVDEARSFHGLIESPQNRLWQRVVAMGKDIAPDHELFAKVATQYTAEDVQPSRPTGADIELDEGPGTSDVDFSFDEAGAAPAGGPDEDEFSSTMMLDTDEPDLAEGDSGLAEPAEAPAAEPAAKATGRAGSSDDESEIEFDLGDLGDLGELGGEPEPSEAEGAAGEAAPRADEGLDIDVDLGGPEEPERGSAEPPEEAASDLGLDLDTGEQETTALDTGGIEALEGETASAAAESGETAGGSEEETAFDLSDLDTGGETETGFDWSELESAEGEAERGGAAAEDAASETASAATEAGAAAEADEDEYDTMLDLARAYIDMGDAESATDALQEVAQSGNERQRREAQSLLETVG